MGGVGVQGQAIQAAQNTSPSEMQLYIKEFMNLMIAILREEAIELKNLQLSKLLYLRGEQKKPKSCYTRRL